MTMTDPVADMLTRIRNANVAGHATVDIPASKIKKNIAEILVKEGYIKGYEVVAGETQDTIRVTMKYGPEKTKVINENGCEVYELSEDEINVFKAAVADVTKEYAAQYGPDACAAFGIPFPEA